MLRSPNCAPQLQPPRSTPRLEARSSNSTIPPPALRLRPSAFCPSPSACLLRHPQIVGLHEHARLGDVGLVDRQPAVVEHIAERRVHAALRRAPDVGLRADVHEPLATLVGVDLGDAVIVRQKQIRVAGAEQIGGADGERPAAGGDPERHGRLLERTVAPVVEHVLAAAVVRVLEALRHDPRRREVPEIDVLRPVPGHEQIEPAVAVVVEPDRAVRVHPFRQAGALRHARERSTLLVVKQLRTAVLVDEQVLEPVVVEVGPDRAHRDAGAGAIHGGDVHVGRHVLERAVALVPVQAVQAAFGAGRHVEVLPAVAIEIGDRHRRAHRRDLRHDVIQPRVEDRRFVGEVHAASPGGFLQGEAVARERAGLVVVTAPVRRSRRHSRCCPATGPVQRSHRDERLPPSRPPTRPAAPLPPRAER